MGEFLCRSRFGLLFIWLFFSSGTCVFAQSLTDQEAKACRFVFKNSLLPLVRDANATCRPQQYKARGPRAKLALKRTDYYENLAKKIRAQNENPESGALPPPMSYDEAIANLYRVRIQTCQRLNDELAQELIKTSQRYPRCEQEPYYQAFRDAWRDNSDQLITYRRMIEAPQEPGPTPSVAEDSPQDSEI